MTTPEATTQATGSSLPAQASDGDARLVLEDGHAIQVHSTLLTLQSSVLSDAVQLAQDSGHKELRIPLPSTPAAEAVVLVTLLYSKRPESHVLSLPLDDLRKLSRICHRFSFDDCLMLVDQALAKHTAGCCPAEVRSLARSKQYLTPDNVVELYWDALEKGMHHFQSACATYMVAHVKEVAVAAPKDALGPVLAETSKQHAIWASRLEKALIRFRRFKELSGVKEASQDFSLAELSLVFTMQSLGSSVASSGMH